MSLIPDVKLDETTLVKEEVYTDQKIGSIRVLIPVNTDGSANQEREIAFYGQTQVMTQAGPLPLNFEIEASSLSEAFAKFGDAAKEGMEKTMREIQEYQREQASKIVVPGQSKSPIHIP